MEGLRNRSKPQRKKRDKKQKHSKIVELLKLEKENSFKIKPEPLSKKKKKQSEFTRINSPKRGGQIGIWFGLFGF